MFSSLADNLDKTFRNLRGVGRISEKNIADALREIRIALLEADVEFGVAKDFIAKVKEKSMGEDVHEVDQTRRANRQNLPRRTRRPARRRPGPARPQPARPHPDLRPQRRGQNHHLRQARQPPEKGRPPARCSSPATSTGPPPSTSSPPSRNRSDVPCYTPDAGETDVVKVARDALAWAEKENATVLIFDTAGRQEIDERLIEELKRLHDFVKPKETLLVADSATGQQAVSVAQHFDEAVGITGIVLTKLDGDARGGAALSMRAVTGKPIKYAGEGEKLDQLFEFHPDRMADRILGMGDIVGMVEQVAGKVNEEDAMRSMKRMQEGKFDFNDFLDQMKMIQNLGPLEGLLGMMPGFSKIKKQLPGGALGHLEASSAPKPSCSR